MTFKLPRPGEHGGDASGIAKAIGMPENMVLDLSMSLNPFAPDFRPVLHRAIDRGVVGRYPDEASALGALAGAMGIAPERLVLTNGGAEAIAVVAATLGTGWTVEPEFSLYRRFIPVLDPDGPRFRSNPHNPLGLLAAPEETAGVWDEAFFPLATGSWTRGDADGQSRSLVVGSLTKLLGCPGLRAGYVICPDEAVARAVSAKRPQWSVNALAAECLAELLQSVDLPSWRSAIADARKKLTEVLESFGLFVRPSDANWVLVEGSPDLRSLLAPLGVVVRDCESFGLAGTFRIAVPDESGLERLDRALDMALADPVSNPDARQPERGHASKASDIVSDQVSGGIFVCGTGSDVGKSAVVAGLCRLFARRGMSVAPFKAQNMALNSWVTDDGAEIGRAQGVQAFAAGVAAEATMNPVLLKPTGERRSQVVVLGKPWADLDASGYQAAKAELAPIVRRCLAELRARFDVVVCEGAGSPAEINLLEHDIVNLRLAVDVGLPAIVVGDIDRGGVLAAFYGTVGLLPDDLRRAVRGFVVNKFRGDPSLLAPGLVELERRTGVPTLGVVPWLDGVDLDAEDSLFLQGRDRGSRVTQGATEPDTCTLDVAAIRFPRISNFTDLDALSLEPDVRVRMVSHPSALGDPDLVLLPGTKTTVDDLAWLRATGLADAIAALAREGRAGRPLVLGICGGYQMLGTLISDPEQVESAQAEVHGLGWLPVTTTFGSTKVVRRRRGVIAIPAIEFTGAEPLEGYEIHHGITVPNADRGAAAPWIHLEDRYSQAGDPNGDDLRGDGITSGAGCMEGMADIQRGVLGTSLHGLLENDDVRNALLHLVAQRRKHPYVSSGMSFARAREERIDRLADALEEHVDIDALIRIVSSARALEPARALESARAPRDDPQVASR